MENSEEEISGFIYVMWIDVFQHYGENVYKVGKSQDVQKRMQSYATSYVKPVELKYISIKCDNYSLAEKLVFYKLSQQDKALEYWNRSLSLQLNIDVQDKIDRLQKLHVDSK